MARGSRMSNSQTNAPEEGLPPKVDNDPKLTGLLEALNQSFHVRQGQLTIGNSVAAYDHGILPDCNYFNVGHPYLIYSLPLAPGETRPNRTPSPDGGWITYRLQQDEAIIFVGKTPPRVDYFSWRSYLFWRFFPNESQFRIVFASLGDTINNKRIKVENKNTTFNRPVVIVTTANREIYNRVRDTLIQAGYSDDMINFDKIPVEMVKMGKGSQTDQFSVLMRMGNFHKKEKGEIYLANRDYESGRVFRLSPREKIKSVPIPGATHLIPRGSGKYNEAVLAPTLHRLRENILNKYGDLQATKLQTGMWIFEGYDAIQRGIDAYGEDRDTIYVRTDPFLLRKDEFVIIYGVNHSVTKKSTYCSWGVYGEKVRNGVTGVSSSEEQFSGNVGEFLEGPEAEKFYVWKIGRCLSEEAGYQQVPYIPEPPDSPDVIRNATCIPLDEEAFVGFRAYVDPDTGVGPAWWEILYGRAIKFSPGV